MTPPEPAEPGSALHAPTFESLTVQFTTVALASFDVFDTLLQRPSLSPNAVLHYVGWLLDRQCGTPTGYFQVRKQAENTARAAKNHKGDVGLGEIYGYFPRNGVWNAALVRDALALELQVEERLMAPRPAVIEAVWYARALGKRLIAVTDSYFPRWFVEKLLHNAALGGVLDEVYVSCELNARKDRGDIWNIVAERERVRSEAWLHIGDNEESDVAQPRAAGIGTFYVQRSFDLLQKKGFYQGPPDRRTWGADLVLGPIATRVAGNPFVGEEITRPVKLEKPVDVGYCVFGPIIFAFICWVIEQSVTNSLDHLYFLSREGFVLERVYRRIRAQSKQLKLPESTYFCASRQLAIAAAMGRSFDPRRIVEAGSFQGTLAQLLSTRLGIDAAQVVELALTLPRDSAAACRRIGDLSSVLAPQCLEVFSTYYNYCESKNLLNPNQRAGIIDIGYSGTMQENLQIVIDRSLIGLYMATLEAAQKVENKGGLAHGCFGKKETTLSCPVLQYGLLLESFLSASHGQVSGITRTEDGFLFQYRPASQNDVDASTLDEMRSGAMAYCDDLLHAYGPDIVEVPTDLAFVQEPLRMLAEREIAVPRRVIDCLRVDDDFTGRGVRQPGQRLLPAD